MAKPQVKTIGKYHLGECIGKGAFGKVYRGLNQETGQTVAIKQLSLSNVTDDKLKSIHKEINLLKRLSHINIVKYIDAISSESHLSIVLEYVEGGSLAGIIKKHRPFPEQLVSKFVGQVLTGLAYLHSQGIVHRDIKGANILLTKNSEVKLADFGVATKLSETVKSMSFAGTPYWMAPEIVENGHGTAACDIWSLGCTVIELLTGAPPYYDLEVMPAIYRLVQDDHPPLPAGISPELTDFLLTCFQKEPLIRVSAQNLLSHEFIQSGGIDRAMTVPEGGTESESEEEEDVGLSKALDDIHVGSLAGHRRSIAQTSIADPVPIEVPPMEDVSDEERKSLDTVIPQAQPTKNLRLKSSRSLFSKSTRMTSDELSPLESPKYREKSASFSDDDSPKTQVQVVNKKEVSEIVKELYVLNPRLHDALSDLTTKMKDSLPLRAAGTECFAHIKEILEETESTEVELSAVKLLRCITYESEYRMTVLASSGLLPALFRCLQIPEVSENKREAANLISELLHQSQRIRELFLGAGGAEQLPLLFIDSDAEDSQSLFLIGLDCMQLLLSQSQSRDHLLTIWARGEAIDRLLLGMEPLFQLEGKCLQAAKLLKKFSKGPKAVMEKLADAGNIDLIASLMKGLPSDVRTVLVTVITNLCAEHSLHIQLENAGLIPELVAWLHLYPDLKKPLLSSLASLCRLSAARLEQAALAGLVPTVLTILRIREEPYIDCSVIFLVGWISASPTTRKRLCEGCALELLLDFLTGTHREKILDGLSTWTMIDQEYCDTVLLRSENLKRVAAVLTNGLNADFELMCLQRMLQSSERLCLSLSKHKEFVETVIGRLNSGAGVNVERSCLEVLLLLCSRLHNPRELLEKYNIYPVLMKLLHVSQEGELVVLEECATMLLARYSQS